MEGDEQFRVTERTVIMKTWTSQIQISVQCRPAGGVDGNDT